MPISYITYALQNGYIHNWLVAGPQIISIDNADFCFNAEAKLLLAQELYTEDSGVTGQPVEPGPLEEAEFSVGAYTAHWAYTVCQEDHFVDGDSLLAITEPEPLPHYARAWAYTEVTTPNPGSVTLVMTTFGPVDVWVNNTHAYHHSAFGFQQAAFTVNLTEGHNAILARFEQVRIDDYPHALALQVHEAPDGMRVQIPTAIEDVKQRNYLENIFNTAYLDRDIFVWEEPVKVHWEARQGDPEDIIIRLQTPSGRIYAESLAVAAPDGESPLISAHQAPQGPLRCILMPPIESYFDHNIRVRRIFPLWGLGLARYVDAPQDDISKRRYEALQHAVRCKGDLFGETAKMALGMWEAIEQPVLLHHIELVNQCAANSSLYLLGLLGMLRRWGNAPDFPKAIQNPLRSCILKFAYAGQHVDNASQSQQLLLYTCAILAGQLYPKRRFRHSGQTGEWHVARAKQQILDWLHARAKGGFAEWDSGLAFESILTALAHLMDLVESEPIWQMTTVVMDKLLLTIALNSFHGILGGTQRRADAAGLLGGWLAPLGGAARLLWGMGIHNPHLPASVSLACMEDYELPPLLQEIATAAPEELLNREQHELTDGERVNKVTYRTPDYMLASAQDFSPGTPGTREHIWQATLGPGAVVFTNHPARSGATEAHIPGFWRGNGTLPRVAQHKDVLIATYNLPDDDWMGFTHAYFPTAEFDSYCMREDSQGHGWAFARKGEGFLAITAAQGCALITRGESAYRELRSPGKRNIWLCHMGRAAQDGDFETFQNRILAMPVMYDDLAVTWTTLRGETLSFGWEGELQLDGQTMPLVSPMHYQNPYCNVELHASQMEIQSANYLMRLKLD
jgi:hypothetical protein